MRLIDADAIEKIFYTMSICSSSDYYNAFNAGAKRIFEEIQNTPTINVELVIHCRDCKKYGTDGCDMVGYCDGCDCEVDLGYDINSNGYCYGGVSK